MATSIFLKYFLSYRKTSGYRRNVDDGLTSRGEEDVLFRPTNPRTAMPEKIGKGGEKECLRESSQIKAIATHER